MKYSASFRYTFKPSAATIDFSNQPGFKWTNIFLILNLTRNVVIYAPGQSSLGASIDATGSIMTLQATVSAHSADDVLLIYADEGDDSLNDLLSLASGSLAADPDLSIQGSGVTIVYPALERLISKLISEVKLTNMLLSNISNNNDDLEALRSYLYAGEGV